MAVAIYGYGSPVGTGNSIEVQAPAIFLEARTGVELQDTGPDGRTHFYVLDGAIMYEQEIGIGEVVRGTADPTPGEVPVAPVLTTLTPMALDAATSSLSVQSDIVSVVGKYLASPGGDRVGQGLWSANAQGISRVATEALDLDPWLADLMI